jgi:hypothetical protein
MQGATMLNPFDPDYKGKPLEPDDHPFVRRRVVIKQENKDDNVTISDQDNQDVKPDVS